MVAFFLVDFFVEILIGSLRVSYFDVLPTMLIVFFELVFVEMD